MPPANETRRSSTPRLLTLLTLLVLSPLLLRQGEGVQGVIPVLPPPPPDYLEYGINPGFADGIYSESPFGDAAMRVKSWRTVENSLLTSYAVPLTADRWPDMEGQALKDPEVKGVGGIIYQRMQGHIPAGATGTLPIPGSPNMTSRPYALVWRGGYEVTLESTPGSVVEVSNPVTQVPEESPGTCPDPALGCYRQRFYVLQPGVIQDKMVYLKIGCPTGGCGAASGLLPARDIYLALPEHSTLNPQGEVIAVDPVNKDWVTHAMQLNGGQGPQILRTLDLFNINAVGVMQTDKTHLLTLADRPKVKDGQPAGGYGVHPVFLAQLANALRSYLHVNVPHRALYRTPVSLVAGNIEVRSQGSNMANGTYHWDTTGGGGSGAHGTFTISGGRLQAGGVQMGSDDDSGGSGYYEDVTLEFHPTDYPGDPNFWVRLKVPAPGAAGWDPQNRQLSDADYETWIRWIATAVKAGVSNHGTLYNGGAPLPTLSFARRQVIFELSNEIWNDGFVQHHQIEALAAVNGAEAGNVSRSAGKEISLAYPWFKERMTGNGIGAFDLCRLFVGATNTDVTFASPSQETNLQGNPIGGVLSTLTPGMRVDFVGPAGYSRIPPDVALKFNAATAQGIKAVKVIAEGQGYTLAGPNPVKVQFSGGGPGGGAPLVAAAASVTLAAGKVTAIKVTRTGKGYVSPPTVTITGGGGTGASAVVETSAIGTGDTGDPDFPIPTRVLEAARSDLALLSSRMVSIRTDGLHGFSHYVNPAPVSDTPIGYVYEAGTSFVAVAPNSDWGPEANEAQSVPECFDLYTRNVDKEGLVKTIRQAGYRYVNWFNLTAFPETGGSGQAFFGHFEYVGQPVAGVPKAQAICRPTSSPERLP